MKRWLAVWLAVLLCVTCVACSGEDTKRSREDEDEGVSDNQNDGDEVCEQAQAAIDEGDYRKAYDLLIAEKDNEQAAKLLERLVFVPIKSSRDGDVTTYTYAWDTQKCVRTTENETVTVIFNEQGDALTDEVVGLGGYWTKYSYTRDENGNALTATYTDSDGASDTYTYAAICDENGNVVAEEYVHSNGDQESYAYTYDKNGNVTVELYDDQNGNGYTTTYTYDADGRRLTERRTDADGFWSETHYTYDGNGYLLAKNRTDMEGGFDKYTYTCDADGNPVRREHSYFYPSMDEEVYTHVYTYQWQLVYLPNGVSKEFIEFRFVEYLWW